MLYFPQIILLYNRTYWINRTSQSFHTIWKYIFLLGGNYIASGCFFVDINSVTGTCFSMISNGQFLHNPGGTTHRDKRRNQIVKISCLDHPKTANSTLIVHTEFKYGFAFLCSHDRERAQRTQVAYRVVFL
jgi:hypothetical protein